MLKKHSKICRLVIFSLAGLALIVGCGQPKEARVTEVERSRSGLDEEFFVASLKPTSQPTGEPSRLLAAMIDRPDATYFIKAMAPVDQIAEVAEGFQSIVQSLTFDSQPISWTIPDGWKEAKGGAQFRLATITAPNGVEIAVTSLSAGQELMSNLNRWQGQIGLPALQEAEAAIQRIKVGNQEVILYDQVGTGAGNSMMPAAPFASGTMGAPPASESKSPNKKTNSTNEPQTSLPPIPFDLPKLDDSWKVLERTESKVARWQKETTSGEILLEVLRFPTDADFLSMAGVWASSIGVNQPTSEQFAESVESIAIGGKDAQWIELPNEKTQRAGNTEEKNLSIRVARVDIGNDAWYFKWVGPTDQMDSMKELGETFLNQVELKQ